MKKLVLPLVALAALALAACSSVKTQVDTGPIRAATYNFVNGGAHPDGTDPREATHQIIQNAISRDLAAKGMTEVAGRGDVTVAYLVIVADNASTQAINTYFGYNDDTAALSDKAFFAFTKSKDPNHFQAGTILIDIVDGKTFKLLKRGYAVRPVLKNPTEAERVANIQSGVDEALATLRITP